MRKDTEVVVANEQPAAGMFLLQPVSVEHAKNHVAAVRQIMNAVMEKDKHYGVIPGTDKPSLYQPGAQLLCMSFRIGTRYTVDTYDRVHDHDPIKYQVTCELYHQPSGTVLGSGVGSANSHEEKYRWKRATDGEYEAAPANMRRIKYVPKQGGGEWQNKQVQRDPSDLDNTLLKMASKRALLHAVLLVTAASDIFNQDLEDLTEELREAAVEEQGKGAGPGPQQRQQQSSGARQGGASAGRPAVQSGGAAAKAAQGAGAAAATGGGAAKGAPKKEDLPEGVEFHEEMANAANMEALAEIMNKLSAEEQAKYRPMFSYMRAHFTAGA